MPIERSPYDFRAKAVFFVFACVASWCMTIGRPAAAVEKPPEWNTRIPARVAGLTFDCDGVKSINGKLASSEDAAHLTVKFGDRLENTLIFIGPDAERYVYCRSNHCTANYPDPGFCSHDENRTCTIKRSSSRFEAQKWALMGFNNSSLSFDWKSLEISYAGGGMDGGWSFHGQCTRASLQKAPKTPASNPLSRPGDVSH